MDKTVSDGIVLVNATVTAGSVVLFLKRFGEVETELKELRNDVNGCIAEIKMLKQNSDLKRRVRNLERRLSRIEAPEAKKEQKQVLFIDPPQLEDVSEESSDDEQSDQDDAIINEIMDHLSTNVAETN